MQGCALVWAVCGVVLALTAHVPRALAQEVPSMATERVWEQKAGDPKRIVVEHVGIPFTNSKGGQFLIHSHYRWRVIGDAGPAKGPVLLSIPGDFADISGLEPEEKPFRMLFSNLTDDTMLTAFNMNRTIHGGVEQCWAYVVATAADGVLVQKPGHGDSPPPPMRSPGVPGGLVGPALKTAKMELQRDGGATLTGVDVNDQPVRYELASWQRPTGSLIYYWKRVAPSHLSSTQSSR